MNHLVHSAYNANFIPTNLYLTLPFISCPLHNLLSNPSPKWLIFWESQIVCFLQIHVYKWGVSFFFSFASKVILDFFTPATTYKNMENFWRTTVIFSFASKSFFKFSQECVNDVQISTNQLMHIKYTSLPCNYRNVSCVHFHSFEEQIT